MGTRLTLFLFSILGLCALTRAAEPDPVTQRLSAIFERFMRAAPVPDADPSYVPGSAVMRRPVFAKDHGCLKAKFYVNPRLAKEFRIGAFAKDFYWAWIRFANDGGYGSDERASARGMSLKLVGVPGKKILDGERDALTQDFVMQNHPIFFASDAKTFLDFIESRTEPDPARRAELTEAYDKAHPETEEILSAIDARKLADPLDGQYWTPTPYRLGKDAMKYMVKPCRPVLDPPIKPMRGKYFLRENLMEHMKEPRDACFHFFVQLRRGPRVEEMPIDDATKLWPAEGPSRFRKFATIIVPTGQDINTEERKQTCENLSMTGWHATPELEPLGSINEARKFVYQKMASIRRPINIGDEGDARLLREPTIIEPIE